MEQVQAIVAWVFAHGGEVTVALGLLAAAFVAIAKLTPSTKDDEVAAEVSKGVGFLARLFGRTPPKDGEKGWVTPGFIGIVLIHVILVAAAIGFLLTGPACASLDNPRNAVYTAGVTLSALEDAMATYCERPDRDADVCERAREADRIAYDLVVSAHRIETSGGDPIVALDAAAKATAALAQILSDVGAK